MARVVLAMSGGVDSSVAAWLLREQGHTVIGLFMRHGAPASTCATGAGSGPKQGCCSAADADDARRVADRLGIPFYALNFDDQFSRIIDYFVDEYASGRTPNPCIVCNTWLKFGKLFDYADSVDAGYVATGHYARLGAVEGDPSPALLRGRDGAKDQSYVLFGVDRRLLPRLSLPVGDYRKEEIRRFAAELGLQVADKPDSQEICFVPDGNHARLVRQQRPELDTAGEIVTTDGKVVGHHEGLERFTVGQRKGLGVALGEPFYVVRLEPDSRRVVLGTREDLARRELTAARCELADRSADRAAVMRSEDPLPKSPGKGDGRTARCRPIPRLFSRALLWSRPGPGGGMLRRRPRARRRLDRGAENRFANGRDPPPPGNRRAAGAPECASENDRRATRRTRTPPRYASWSSSQASMSRTCSGRTRYSPTKPPWPSGATTYSAQPRFTHSRPRSSLRRSSHQKPKASLNHDFTPGPSVGSSPRGMCSASNWLMNVVSSRWRNVVTPTPTSRAGNESVPGDPSHVAEEKTGS